MELHLTPESIPVVSSYLRMLIQSAWPADPNVRVIAVTGSTLAGKSQLCDQLSKEDVGKKWMFMPEVYSELVLKHGMPHADPDSATDVLRAQATVFLTQMTRERELGLEAKYPLKSGIVVDRSLLDNAAFLHGGLEELTDFVGTSRAQLFARYSLILHLGIVPESLYELKRVNNPSRRPEPYANIVAREERLRKIYEGHPRYQFLPFSEQWNGKKMKARMAILEYI